jgi:2-dehydro-3-deoxygluconokinase
MKSIYFLGECMVELRRRDEATMSQSYAGDVYNSAVYLHRCFPDVSSSIVTAVGKDTLSDRMLTTFQKEGIGTKYVFRHDDKVAGMYLIETDETGERSFTYWRSDAAARKIVPFLTDEIVEALSSADMFFFSGISLAVISPEDRAEFWRKLAQLKAKGVSLVFDPNYRPRLWTGEEEAKEQFSQAFSVSQVVLPGVDDFASLYGISTAQGIVDFCQEFDHDEVVIKNGPQSVLTVFNGSLTTHTIVPVENVVDTTSAGDAFNGAYLGARLSGLSVSDAVKCGAKAAGVVIQHPGAIVHKEAFEQGFNGS